MAIWGKLLLINVTGKSVEGTYRCNASNGVREQASATIKLTVQSRYPSIDTNVMSHDYDSSRLRYVRLKTYIYMFSNKKGGFTPTLIQQCNTNVDFQIVKQHPL